mgnify:CR=1 FL=1
MTITYGCLVAIEISNVYCSRIQPCPRILLVVEQDHAYAMYARVESHLQTLFSYRGIVLLLFMLEYVLLITIVHFLSQIKRPKYCSLKGEMWARYTSILSHMSNVSSIAPIFFMLTLLGYGEESTFCVVSRASVYDTWCCFISFMLNKFIGSNCYSRQTILFRWSPSLLDFLNFFNTLNITILWQSTSNGPPY